MGDPGNADVPRILLERSYFNKQEEKTMADGKLYLLAEFVVKPELLEETKAIFSTLLPRVLEEPGCEAMYTTSADAEANKLVFLRSFCLKKLTNGTWHRIIRSSLP